METLKMHSLDGVQRNIELIGELFPNAITEVKRDGKVEHAIDFDVLRQELSDSIVEGREERYQFTWPDKKKAMLAANAPITATLRPVVADSVGKDGTPGGFDSENLYIEGDNLEVLKLLQETYLGKVKMIYIDPPYNTGNDFVYEDDFAQSAAEYMDNSGQYDEEGNRLVTNTESNGRFHTDWLNMIYPRLKIAKDLLADDGVVFISIDDNELNNLKKCCDEIFGEQRFLAIFVWKRRASSQMDKSKCSTDHEYVLAYKGNDFKVFRGIDKDYKGYSNPDNDPRGPWTTGDLTVGMTGDMRPNQYYDLVDPKTGKVYKPNYNRVWSYIPESMNQLIAENRIVFPEDTTKRPMKKRFASELDSGTNPQSTWMDGVGMNTEGTKQMYDLFGKAFFSYTKPVSLVKALTLQVARAGDIVLDFFSGSATTAHAVMQLNAEDGGHRKFIMVQLPEKVEDDAYATICEIGKERIRRAAKKIAEENPNAVFDNGFRVFKLDESNMKDVFYTPAEYDQNLLAMLESNIKEDRTDLDLLFGCLLEWGLPLSMPYTSEEISGCTIHTYNDGDLIACFDVNIPDEVVKTIAKRQPLRAVFRDSSFDGSPAKINVTEVFKLLAPDTRVKVI